ncbi:lactoylglutathione lyase [Endozoicomonas acroporae]|uniref:lactoylglutathione lyase n=1 Tax=Endozoicomonas acroporae TaxID=1701104 RepID=UPI003D7B6D4C
MKYLHTMIRVKNLDDSIQFYTEKLGMQLFKKSVNEQYKYTLAFVGYDESAMIELTYNWDNTEGYDLGTAFGHIALGHDDIYSLCDSLKKKGVTIKREPNPVLGGSTHIAFITDPDGYSIELIQTSTMSKTDAV